MERAMTSPVLRMVQMCFPSVTGVDDVPLFLENILSVADNSRFQMTDPSFAETQYISMVDLPGLAPGDV